MPLTVGWKTHSGWAWMVAVEGPPVAPVIVERRRVALLDEQLPHQPYHAAVADGLDLDAAQALIRRVEEAAAGHAAAALAGLDAVGVGVVAGQRRLPKDLAAILRSHPLLHAAEGDLYEQAVIEAAVRAGLPVSVTPNMDHAAATLGVDLKTALMAAGKVIGPPWQKDHREAAAAALAALKPTS